MVRRSDEQPDTDEQDEEELLRVRLQKQKLLDLKTRPASLLTC